MKIQVFVLVCSSSICLFSGNTLQSVFAAEEVSAQEGSFDCEKECDDSTILCWDLSKSILLPGIGDAIREIQKKKKKDQPISIEKTYLLSTFDIESDSCERTDTSIADDVIKNSGLVCDIITELKIKSDSLPLEIGFLIPTELEGKTTLSNNLQIFEFDDLEKSPLLLIGRKGLYNEWGGKINSVFLEEKIATVETVNGCTRIGF